MSPTSDHWPSHEIRERLRPIQQITAERLQVGWQTTVPATLMTEVDARGLLSRRAHLAEKGVRPGLTAIIATRLASVLARHPAVNCRIDGEDRVSWPGVNLGMAIAGAGTDLVVGVVRDADRCDENEVSARISDLRDRAERRKLRPEDTRGAVVTLSSVGMMISGVFGTPVVPPDQTAVVLVSGMVDRPVVEGAELVVAPVLPISVTVDHRVVNGAAMSAFLNDFCTELGATREKGD
ncbi:2-oxo acid dehydrogenase subunit E2 [Nocardioides alcanivorans]|uniref:2-oxo acid dehydrogenase subunit E2 n=1 Tax=Nocardioides alcanivorans TaxID=2897352 RepID=UPI001F40AB62|nr:2-oxo acid dehydrogenase subunit E2 [Nocardioides alcanivorans]